MLSNGNRFDRIKKSSSSLRPMDSLPISGFYRLFGEGLNCNGYLIKQGADALIIDCGLGRMGVMWGNRSESAHQELTNVIRTNHVKKICLTHAHLDHSGGLMHLNQELRSQLSIKAHEFEAPYLAEPDYDYIDPITREKSFSIRIDHQLKNGDTISVGEFDLEVLHTPGHTEGSICLYLQSLRILFSGDTVFPMASFGRTDFP